MPRTETGNEHPEYFYKYRSLNQDQDYTKEILIDNKLHCSLPGGFNDPFDCVPALSWAGSEEEKHNFAKSLVSVGPLKGKAMTIKHAKAALAHPIHGVILRARAESNLRRMITTQQKILSLSKNMSSVLMWSHYADKHKGICFRFKVTAENQFGQRSQPIKYRKEREPIFLLRDIAALRAIQKALYTKAEEWAYEEEWRIIIFPDDGIADPAPEDIKDKFEFEAEDLNGIYLGAKITDEYETLVREWVTERGRDIEIIKTRISETEYKIEEDI